MPHSQASTRAAPGATEQPVPSGTAPAARPYLLGQLDLVILLLWLIVQHPGSLFPADTSGTELIA